MLLKEKTGEYHKIDQDGEEAPKGKSVFSVGKR